MAAAFAALLAWRRHATMACVVVATSVALVVLALASPTRGWVVFERALDKLTALVGTLAAIVLLWPLYFVVIAPLGWVLRRRGALRYETGFDEDQASYWTRREAPCDLRKPY